MKSSRILLALVLSLPAVSQVQTGIPQFGTFKSFGPATLNLGNLNVHVSIPLYGKPGRGLSFGYKLNYDTSLWLGGGPAWVLGPYTLVGGASAPWVREAGFGWVEYFNGTDTCVIGLRPPFHITHPAVTVYGNYHDPSGAFHAFHQIIGGCNHGSGGTQTTDGFTMTATSSGVTIATPAGDIITPVLNGNSTGSAHFTDVNGNQLSTDGTNFIDTLGLTAATVSGANPVTVTYTDTTGLSRSVSVNYTQYTLQTSFGCSGASEASASRALVSSIVYPDGSSYQLTYESTAGHTPGDGVVTGRISSITLPTGGVIGFSYTGTNDGIVCADGTTSGITVTTSDGAWQYARTPLNVNNIWQTTATDPQNNQTVFNFSGITPTLMQAYQGVISGSPIRTLTICYNGATVNCPLLPVSGVGQRATTLQLDNNQQKKIVEIYNTSGLLTETDEFDYGAVVSGPLKRKTVIAYASLGNNLLNRPSSVTVFDGGNHQAAQTTFSYDDTALQPSGATGLAPIVGSRGNLTHKNAWLSTTNSFLTTTYNYFDTGELQSVTDPGGHTTSLGYGCNGAYPTQTNMPDTSSPNLAHHGVSATYDCNTGLMMSNTDQNNRLTSYSYDSMFRLLQTTFPDGGQTTITYPSMIQTVVQRKIDASRSTYSTVLLDGYGRVSRTAVANGEAVPYDQQDICYNSNGLVAFRSYPYQGNGFSAPKVCTGAGDSATYDAMARLQQIAHADGTVKQYSYSGRATQVTGEGNGTFNLSRIVQSDGLGRLTSICEISGVTLLGNGGTPAACGLDIAGNGFFTSYSYDTLDNLVAVAQGSLAARTYAYDSLSHLTSESEAEWIGTGGTQSTVSFSYNSDGRLLQRVRPAPNQTNPAVTVTSTYSYDELHRLRSVSYSDGTTPGSSFNYDETNPWGVTAFNTNGRLTTQSGAGGQAGAVFSYDSMGRVVSNWQCTPRNCGLGSYALGYAYDFLGDMVSFLNGAGVTFGYSYNSAGRLAGMSSNLVDAQHPAALASNIHYGPFGPVSDTLGNGITESFGYTPFGALQSYSATPYAFSLGFAGDGSIISSNDSQNGNWTYGYDQFDRIVSANKTSGVQTFSYVYDRYGNRLQQNAPQGGPAPQYIFDNNNHISGSGVFYDALGNITNDGFNTYSYDAENHLTKVNGGSTAAYTYDATGKRVRTSTTEYVYDLAGHAVALFDLSGIWGYGEIYAGSRHLASYSGNTTNFMHPDWLGTKRVMTDLQGAISETCSGMPFGDGVSCTGTDWNFNRFTDDQHDFESNLEYALYRQYSGTQGRFLMPDPYAGSMSVGNPQSLNRYPYVDNNPLGATDRAGLVIIPHSWYVSAITAANYLGGNCSMDGVSAPCGMVNSFLRGNGVMQCPNNSCVRVRWVDNPKGDPESGHWEDQQFWAFANGGSGYYTIGAGPGSLSYSADQAGQTATSFFEGKTQDDHRERGGNVYEDSGEVFSYNYIAIADPCDPAASKCSLEHDNSVPDGSTFSGDWHTHPYERGLHQFDFDRNTSSNPSLHVPGYVGYSSGGSFGTMRIDRGGSPAPLLSPQGLIFVAPICQMPGGPVISGISPCQ